MLARIRPQCYIAVQHSKAGTGRVPKSTGLREASKYYSYDMIELIARYRATGDFERDLEKRL